jgi:uncharacterized protein with HEPN domain
VKSDQPYLGHIADSIAAIENYVAAGRETFLRERMVQDAVIRNFEIIGEAASKLSRRTRATPGIPWAKSSPFALASFIAIGVLIFCWSGM